MGRCVPVLLALALAAPAVAAEPEHPAPPPGTGRVAPLPPPEQQAARPEQDRHAPDAAGTEDAGPPAVQGEAPRSVPMMPPPPRPDGPAARAQPPAER